MKNHLSFSSSPHSHSLENRVLTLIQDQSKHFPAYANALYQLASIQSRVIDFRNFSMILQHNPHRMQSVAAFVGSNKEKNADCILCRENLLADQSFISWNSYMLLVNPWPVVSGHLTIIHQTHRPQRIDNYLADLLDLSRELGCAFVTSYNGPRCGASVPGHLHFQAIPADELPLYRQWEKIAETYGQSLFKSAHGQISAINDSLRKILVLESPEKRTLHSWFDCILRVMREPQTGEAEPKMNILINRVADSWRVCVFLREKHRPDVFYSKESDKILMSPGAIDLGGLCILPVQRDFERIDATALQEIFNEISIEGQVFQNICGALQRFQLPGNHPADHVER